MKKADIKVARLVLDGIRDTELALANAYSICGREDFAKQSKKLVESLNEVIECLDRML